MVIGRTAIFKYFHSNHYNFSMSCFGGSRKKKPTEVNPPKNEANGSGIPENQVEREQEKKASNVSMKLAEDAPNEPQPHNNTGGSRVGA